MCNYNGVCFNSMQGYNRYVCQNCYNLCMGIPNCYESRQDPVNLNYGINGFIPNNIIPSKFDAVTNGYRDNTGVANGFFPTNINVNTHDDNKVEVTSSNSLIPPQVTPVEDGTVRHQTQPEVMILYDSSKKFLTIEESISMVPREQGSMPTAKINQSQMNEKVETKPSSQSVKNVVDNTQGKKDKSTLVTGSSLRIQNDEVSKTKSLCSERSKRTSIKQFKSTAQTECKQKDKRISGRNSMNNENQTISSSEKPIIDTPNKDSKEMKPSIEKLKSSEKVSMPKDPSLHKQVDVVQVKPNLKSKTSKENKLKSSNQIASNAKEKKLPVSGSSNKNKTEFLMNKSKNHNDIKGLWNERMPTCKEVSNFIKKNVPLRNSMEKFSFCKPLNAEQKSLLNKLLAKKRATGGSSHVPGCLHLKLNLESNKKDNIDVNKTKECKRCKKATTESENKLGKAKRKSKLKKKSKSSPGMMADEEPKTRAKNVLLSCNVPLCLSLPEEINWEHLIKAPNENPVVSLINKNNGCSDLPRSEIQWIRMPPTDVKTVEQPCLASNASTYMRSFHDPNKTPATHSCPCYRLPLPDSPSTSFPAAQQYPSSFQSFLQNSSLPAGPSSYPCTPCNSQPSPQPAPCEEKKPNPKKRQKSRKTNNRPWLSEMYCFRKLLKSCICQGLSTNRSTPCCLQYCNCKTRANEVQPKICVCKECTLHLRKNQIQKEVDSKKIPNEICKSKPVKWKIDSDVSIVSKLSRTSSILKCSQECKSKSVKLRKDPTKSITFKEPSTSSIKKSSDQRRLKKNKTKSDTVCKSSRKSLDSIRLRNDKLNNKKKCDTYADLSASLQNCMEIGTSYTKFPCPKEDCELGNLYFNEVRKKLVKCKERNLKTPLKNKKLTIQKNNVRKIDTYTDISASLRNCKKKGTSYIQFPCLKDLTCDLGNLYFSEVHKDFVKPKESHSKTPLKNQKLPISRKLGRTTVNCSFTKKKPKNIGKTHHPILQKLIPKRILNKRKVECPNNKKKQEEDVKVLLKARRLRNGSRCPDILEQDKRPSSSGFHKQLEKLKNSKVCICSLKLLQALREDQHLQQISEFKNKNYNMYFHAFQKKAERSKCCKCKKPKNKIKPNQCCRIAPKTAEETKHKEHVSKSSLSLKQQPEDRQQKNTKRQGEVIPRKELKTSLSKMSKDSRNSTNVRRVQLGIQEDLKKDCCICGNKNQLKDLSQQQLSQKQSSNSQFKKSSNTLSTDQEIPQPLYRCENKDINEGDNSQYSQYSQHPNEYLQDQIKENICSCIPNNNLKDRSQQQLSQMKCKPNCSAQSKKGSKTYSTDQSRCRSEGKKSQYSQYSQQKLHPNHNLQDQMEKICSCRKNLRDLSQQQLSQKEYTMKQNSNLQSTKGSNTLSSDQQIPQPQTVSEGDNSQHIQQNQHPNKNVQDQIKAIICSCGKNLRDLPDHPNNNVQDQIKAIVCSCRNNLRDASQQQLSQREFILKQNSNDRSNKGSRTYFKEQQIGRPQCRYEIKDLSESEKSQYSQYNQQKQHTNNNNMFRDRSQQQLSQEEYISRQNSNSRSKKGSITFSTDQQIGQPQCCCEIKDKIKAGICNCSCKNNLQDLSQNSNSQSKKGSKTYSTKQQICQPQCRYKIEDISETDNSQYVPHNSDYKYSLHSQEKQHPLENLQDQIKRDYCSCSKNLRDLSQQQFSQKEYILQQNSNSQSEKDSKTYSTDQQIGRPQCRYKIEDISEGDTTNSQLYSQHSQQESHLNENLQDVKITKYIDGYQDHLCCCPSKEAQQNIESHETSKTAPETDIYSQSSSQRLFVNFASKTLIGNNNSCISSQCYSYRTPLQQPQNAQQNIPLDSSYYGNYLQKKLVPHMQCKNQPQNEKDFLFTCRENLRDETKQQELQQHISWNTGYDRTYAQRQEMQPQEYIDNCDDNLDQTYQQQNYFQNCLQQLQNSENLNSQEVEVCNCGSNHDNLENSKTLQDEQLQCICRSASELDSLEDPIGKNSWSVYRPYVTQSTWNLDEYLDSKQIPGPLQEAQRNLICQQNEMKRKNQEKQIAPMIHSNFYYEIIKKFNIQPMPDDQNQYLNLLEQQPIEDEICSQCAPQQSFEQHRQYNNS